MSGFWIVLIAIGYVILSAIIYGVVYGLTEDDIKGAIFALFWPIIIIITPFELIGRLAYKIVKSIKEKQND